MIFILVKSTNEKKDLVKHKDQKIDALASESLTHQASIVEYHSK